MFCKLTVDSLKQEQKKTIDERQLLKGSLKNNQDDLANKLLIKFQEIIPEITQEITDLKQKIKIQKKENSEADIKKTLDKHLLFSKTTSYPHIAKIFASCGVLMDHNFLRAS